MLLKFIKRILVFFVLFPLFACNNDKQKTPTPPEDTVVQTIDEVKPSPNSLEMKYDAVKVGRFEWSYELQDQLLSPDQIFISDLRLRLKDIIRGETNLVAIFYGRGSKKYDVEYHLELDEEMTIPSNRANFVFEVNSVSFSNREEHWEFDYETIPVLEPIILVQGRIIEIQK